MDLIWVGRETENFCEGDWTGSISLIRLNKSGCARRDVRRVSDSAIRRVGGCQSCRMGLSPSRNPSHEQAAMMGIAEFATGYEPGMDAEVLLPLKFRDRPGVARFRNGKAHSVAGMNILQR
jgi:hypothetical protein